MAKKVAINGFGRIGRLTFRAMFDDKDIEIVAINDLTDTATLAHLLKYDSAQGNYKIKTIKSGKDFLEVDGKKIMAYQERDPKALP
jgi:glyceraldehyde 3-phosphate dehydrogenase